MIVAIVQARMGSTRLPGKVLRIAAGRTFLEHLVERLGFCRTLDKIVVATSTAATDDPIAALCERTKVECFRGSENDVLDRYYLAAKQFAADPVVRVTADCPLIDPTIVDEIVSFQQDHAKDYDLVTNRHPLTYPDGLDVDVIPVAALAIAHRQARLQPQREHVIPYFWESGMRVMNVAYAENLFTRYRWTVDYEEDAQLVAEIFDALYRPGRAFGMREILDFLDRHPEFNALNARYLPEASSE